MILGESEIEQAIIEYLERRGVAGIGTSQLTISHWQSAAGGNVYQVEVKSVELPLREGPYR